MTRVNLPNVTSNQEITKAVNESTQPIFSSQDVRTDEPGPVRNAHLDKETTPINFTETQTSSEKNEDDYDEMLKELQVYMNQTGTDPSTQKECIEVLELMYEVKPTTPETQKKYFEDRYL